MVEEEKVGGMNPCHCTRALAVLLRALFTVVLGPLAKRGICSQFSYLYRVVILEFYRKISKKDHYDPNLQL